MASTSVVRPLYLASASPCLTGSSEASPLKCPRIGEGDPHRVSLLVDPGHPHRRLWGPRTHWLGLTRQRAGSRETPHLFVPASFNEANRDPRLATTQTEPATSKPVVP